MHSIDPSMHDQFQHALARGDMFALFERTREAIRLYPDDPEARFLQTLAMARLGEPHAAMRLYERYRVEEIENPLTQQVRYLDKLVDELAKGRKMEKILRVA